MMKNGGENSTECCFLIECAFGVVRDFLHALMLGRNDILVVCLRSE